MRPRLWRPRVAALALALVVSLPMPALRGALAAPPPVALAGVDLPDAGGAAAWRGGVAFVTAGGERVLLAVCDPAGRAVRRLDAWDADGTAWVWDGRDARGAAVVAGGWVVRLDSPTATQRAAIARALRPPGERPRVTFGIRAVAGP